MEVWTAIIFLESDLLISSILSKPHVLLHLTILCFLTFPTHTRSSCLQGLEHSVVCCIIVYNTKCVVTHLPGECFWCLRLRPQPITVRSSWSESANGKLYSREEPRGPSHHCTSKYLLAHLLVTVLTLPFLELFQMTGICPDDVFDVSGVYMLLFKDLTSSLCQLR